MPEPGASPLSQAPPPARSPLFHAEQFVWLTARVLEQRLFAYHFLHGSADPVETALDAYRNDDGGYGHALSPDLRGPVSQPLHARRALQVLDAIGRCGGQRVDRVCRYLTSVSAPDGALPAVHPSLRGYPAAPSLPVVEPAPSSLLATGPVVGLLHRNEVWHAWLFRATDSCWQVVESLEKPDPYEVEAAVAFLDRVPDRPRAEAAADRLGRLVRRQRLVTREPGGTGGSPLAEGASRFPHEYAPRPDSLARAWFTDEDMNRSLDQLTAEQQEDGGWPTRHPAWAPGITLETGPTATIEALLTLRAYGRHIG